MRHHRHNKAPRRVVFSVGVEVDGELVGVACAEWPKAAGYGDGDTIEITRVCTLGHKNACSMLYGACCRAARALGYTRVVTYTLASEPGASLKASGFRRDADLPARDWEGDNPHRERYQTDLFGERKIPTGPKVRWMKEWR